MYFLSGHRRPDSLLLFLFSYNFSYFLCFPSCFLVLGRRKGVFQLQPFDDDESPFIHDSIQKVFTPWCMYAC